MTDDLKLGDLKFVSPQIKRRYDEISVSETERKARREKDQRSKLQERKNQPG